MITITPNVPPPSLGGQMRFPPPGVIQPRTQAPQRPQFFNQFRAYRQGGGGGPVIFDPEFDGKRLRKSAMRKTVDYNASIIKMLQCRVWQRDFRDRHGLVPDAMYIPDILPPSAYQDNPINAVTTRFVKTATNKMRCPIFCMAWTPEGRRLVTGASSGEFTLWNGLTFNFETILQAHESPVRTMVWSHNEMWMVTADHSGYVKYWQSNMNNVKMFMAHQEPIRGISFSASDSKFASCSDDGTVKIWDFYRCIEERTLRGHGADVKCIDWHPHKGLVISGSKDNQQPVKLWDPKTGNPLATIHAHKSTVMDIKWNANGNWFITASRDHLLKLFDIRNLSSEVQTFRGHKKESSSVAWHPVHEGLFCSGGSDGAILFWHVGTDKEVGVIEQAHDSIVWTLAWHPMGHILCSGSNDHTSKFWTRNRPGDAMRDKYNLNTLNMTPLDHSMETDLGDDGMAAIPGMGPEDRVEDTDLSMGLGMTGLSSGLLGATGANPGPLPPGAIPGLEDYSDMMQDEKNKAQAKRVPYSKPIPKNFQAQWNDTVIIESDDEPPEEIDMAALVNQILENYPGVKPVSQIQPEALYIYGKVLAVEPGSELAQMISEGGERLIKYIHSGAIHDLEDVIPHYETEDGQAMPYINYQVNPNIEVKSLEASDKFPPLRELVPGIEDDQCGYPMEIKESSWIDNYNDEDDNYNDKRDRDHRRDRDSYRSHRDRDDYRKDDEGFGNSRRRRDRRRDRERRRHRDDRDRRDGGRDSFRNDDSFDNRNDEDNFSRNEGRFNRNDGGGFNRNNSNGGFNRDHDEDFRSNSAGGFNNDGFNSPAGMNRNDNFNRNDGFNDNNQGFNNENESFNDNYGDDDGYNDNCDFNDSRGGFSGNRFRHNDDRRNRGGGPNRRGGGNMKRKKMKGAGGRGGKQGGRGGNAGGRWNRDNRGGRNN